MRRAPKYILRTGLESNSDRLRIVAELNAAAVACSEIRQGLRADFRDSVGMQDDGEASCTIVTKDNVDTAEKAMNERLSWLAVAVDLEAPQNPS
jgi:hypothetical protein